MRDIRTDRNELKEAVLWELFLTLRSRLRLGATEGSCLYRDLKV